MFNKILRVTIIRDPFERFLSAWMQKCIGRIAERKSCHWVPCEQPDNFTAYVHCVWNEFQTIRGPPERRLCRANVHFRPQTCGCGFSKMRYDLVLPTRLLSVWYEPLIKCMQIEKSTKRFWADKTPFYEDHANHSKEVNVGAEATHSREKMSNYYTSETYALVGEMYSADLLFRDPVPLFDEPDV